MKTVYKVRLSDDGQTATFSETRMERLHSILHDDGWRLTKQQALNHKIKYIKDNIQMYRDDLFAEAQKLESLKLLKRKLKG